MLKILTYTWLFMVMPIFGYKFLHADTAHDVKDFQVKLNPMIGNELNVGWFTHQGHEYLLFSAPGISGFQVVHDPDCECRCSTE